MCCVESVAVTPSERLHDTHWRTQHLEHCISATLADMFGAEPLIAPEPDPHDADADADARRPVAGWSSAAGRFDVRINEFRVHVDLSQLVRFVPFLLSLFSMSLCVYL